MALKASIATRLRFFMAVWMRGQWQGGEGRHPAEIGGYCRLLRLKTHAALANRPRPALSFAFFMPHPSASSLDPALLQAYRETDYIVQAGPDFVLHVDQYCAALAAYYGQHGIGSGCVITACNPYSQLLADAENQARQA